jgi:hypothetical protein
MAGYAFANPPYALEVLDLVRRWLDDSVGSNQATPILVEMVQCEPLDAADLRRALQHIDMGAPGSGYLFSVVAATLQNADQATQHALRIELSQGTAIVCSQALRWKAVR